MKEGQKPGVLTDKKNAHWLLTADLKFNHRLTIELIPTCVLVTSYLAFVNFLPLLCFLSIFVHSS